MFYNDRFKVIWPRPEPLQWNLTHIHTQYDAFLKDIYAYEGATPLICTLACSLFSRC